MASYEERVIRGEEENWREVRFEDVDKFFNKRAQFKLILIG